MPTGFEQRRPIRQTFAITGPDPVQVNPSAQGNLRRPDVVGGNSRGGVVAAEASAPSMGAQLGEFFGRVMEPHVRKRQQEEFIRGAVAQMGRQAGDEIEASSGGFSKIFGQTAFVEGAVHYRVQQAASAWAKDTTAKEDNLKRMSDEDLAKYLSDSIQQLSTGDPYTDTQVQAAVFEQAGPVMQTIAKKRYVWQQEEAKTAHGDSIASQGDVFQRLSVDLAGLSAPDDTQVTALAQATNNMRAALIKPHGMADDTYREALVGAWRRASEAGNGYLTRLMRDEGFLDLLDDEARTKLEQAEYRLSSRARGDAAMVLGPEISALDGAIAFNRISPNEAMAEAARINDKYKRMTGFDFDLFDYKDVTGYGKSVWSALKTQADREESRRQSIEDEMRRRQWALEDKQAEAAQTAAQVSAFWGAGQVGLGVGMGNGITDSHFQTLAQVDYAGGNFSRIVKAHQTDGWVAKNVANQMQAQIKTYIGRDYSKDFELGYRRWAALNAADQSAAADYMGTLQAPMLNYHRMVQSGTDRSVAFATAFGNPAQYVANGGDNAAADVAIEAFLENQTSAEYWFTDTPMNPYAPRNLNASGRESLKNALRQEVAVRKKGVGADLSDEVLVAQALDHATRNGSFERYGQLGWRNAPGTKPLSRHMQLQPQEAQEVVPQVIDAALKKAGFEAGAYGDQYTFRYVNRSQGLVLAVQPFDEEGQVYPVVSIPVSDFVNAARKYRADKVGKPAMSSRHNFNGVNAYRRIPGESAADRLARINREAKAGADPVYHRK